MNTSSQPSTLSDWMSANGQAVTLCFRAVPEGQYLVRPAPGRWSPAEHFDHLIRSARPVARAFELPRFMLRLLFGAATHPAETYDDLRARYRELLQAGAGATGRYVPVPPAPATDPAQLRSEHLDRWGSTLARLNANLARWADRDLDRLALPHPIFGSISVRQMLYFTHFHNLHHIDDVQGLLNTADHTA